MAYLPSLLSLLNGIILIGLGVGITWWWKTYDARKAAEKEVAKDKAQWRDQRLSAEKTLAEAIAAETRNRTLWQLENATDLERVVGILKEFGDAQRLLAVIASDNKHHAGDIEKLNRRLETLEGHLNEFILRHVK